MVAEIQVTRNYSFFIQYIKDELVELLFEGGQTPERFRNLISLIRSNPDRVISNMINNFVSDFHNKLPDFFVKALKKSILRSPKDKSKTLKEFVLASYKKRA